jgi:hypothetical protein
MFDRVENPAASQLIPNTSTQTHLLLASKLLKRTRQLQEQFPLFFQLSIA